MRQNVVSVVAIRYMYGIAVHTDISSVRLDARMRTS
jgi:hypothetical protein